MLIKCNEKNTDNVKSISKSHAYSWSNIKKKQWMFIF